MKYLNSEYKDSERMSSVYLLLKEMMREGVAANYCLWHSSQMLIVSEANAYGIQIKCLYHLERMLIVIWLRHIAGSY